MASCMLSITIVNGYSLVLSVKMFNALCHSTAIQLSVLDHVGIESSDSFASVTNAPQSRVWSSSQSFNHWILLRIPQTRFRPSGFSWMPPSVLAYTTKTLISRNGWLVCQASTRLSGDQPCIVQSGIQEIFTKPQMLVEQEWLSVTLFMGENDDECHGSSHSSSWRTSDILEQEQAELNGRTIVIALILEVQ